MRPRVQSQPPPRSVPVAGRSGGGHYVYRGDKPLQPPRKKLKETDK